MASASNFLGASMPNRKTTTANARKSTKHQSRRATPAKSSPEMRRAPGRTQRGHGGALAAAFGAVGRGFHKAGDLFEMATSRARIETDFRLVNLEDSLLATRRWLERKAQDAFKPELGLEAKMDRSRLQAHLAGMEVGEFVTTSRSRLDHIGSRISSAPVAAARRAKALATKVGNALHRFGEDPAKSSL